MEISKIVKNTLKEISEVPKESYLKYEKLINKLVYEVFGESICGFNWEVFGLENKKGPSIQIVLHFTKNSYQKLNYQKYEDDRKELKELIQNYLPKFDGIYIAWNTTRCDDTHKEEETEGVGGYAAPAFEMKPDHVHFKHLYNESELTERCWKGYTQKGMKTMFGKRYPNCVKIKKKKSLKESIKNALDEQVTKKYPKPTEKVDKLVYRWLDNYFEGSQVYKYEGWKYYSFRFEFCNNGRAIADLHVRFDDRSPDFGPKDKRPTNERSVEEVNLYIYPDMIKELLADIPIRKNYLLYLIEEWFEDTQLDKIQQEFNRNDLSLDHITMSVKQRGDICVPPVSKPVGVTMQDMMDLIKKTTLYSYKDIEKREEEEPGWIEDLYLAKLRGKEHERVNREDNEGTLREEVAEPKKRSVKDSLQQMIDKIGVMPTAEFVGGIDNLVKLRYGGNLKSFYDENNFIPYKYSDDGMVMYIDDVMIQHIGSPLHYTKKEKSLGNFSYGSKNGIKYNFDARVDGPRMGMDGQLWWRVIGTSGDSGFGYGWITQKNRLGKRYRQQIFQQIIDRYNLNQYM